jgi:hypothetical protein
MRNYSPKGVEHMRELGRRGGLKSGETRQEKEALKMILGEYASERGIDLDAALAAKPAKRPNLSGGTDWRCANPDCRHFNSIKRRVCAKCLRYSGL